MITDEMIMAQIRDVIEEIRPQFLMHGGNIKLVGFDRGVVKVKLSGACDGCPSSNYTLKLLVESTLKKEVPQVVLVEEVFD